ncbi:MAG: ATPase, T2SS/T4P/T4SS family [Verrucomicrobiota bacterium]|nr:ATPase, T2SS/T4P/T4SS family [Verrucomicrobiota bacterium]
MQPHQDSPTLNEDSPDLQIEQWEDPKEQVAPPIKDQERPPRDLNGRLSNYLRKTGMLEERLIEYCLRERTRTGAPLIQVILESSLVEPLPFLQKLAEILGLEFVNLSGQEIPVEVRTVLPTRILFQHQIIPLRDHHGVLLLATQDPFNIDMLDAVRLLCRKRIQLCLAQQEDILQCLRQYYGVGADTLDAMMAENRIDLDALEEDLDKKDLDEVDQEASVMKFVNQIIWEAYQDRATDIHLEPMENDLRIRYRVDGVLHQTPVPPHLKRFQPAIIARIKVMSNMDIAEKRLPQDGRINVRIKGEEIDVRVSTVPTVYGESVSLRLLTRSSVLLGLDMLGLSPRDRRVIEHLIRLPHGIMLVTGPTGSGKSTSLYAYLSTINSIDKRIITVEDPIEYELAGINQIQVRPEIDLTFAVGLRHILRQDPDVIMIGEIRDGETADIAIRAALTGHLVFSTLHTNDSAGAMTRLLDMGIEPFLVASSIEGIIAQRLVRRICPACREPIELDKNLLKRSGFPEDEIDDAVLYHGTGCEKCRKLGFRGRSAIFEILLMTDEVRKLVIERKDASSIKNLALTQGMRTLRDDGWRKMKEGITTLEEVLRVSQEDEDLTLI